MSVSALALLGLIAWSLLLVVVLVSQRGIWVLSGKMAVNAFRADGSNAPSHFGQRLVRAHANCLENLPLQAALLLYAIATSQTAITDPLALTLLAARLLQSALHLLSTHPLFVWLRFAAFFVQLLIMGWWLLRLSGLTG